MMFFSHGLVSAAFLLVGADGFRKKIAADMHNARGGGPAEKADVKVIAGVPVFNYHAIHDGVSSLLELDSDTEREWVLVVKASTTDAEITTLCEANPNQCNLAGRPSEGGVPFVEMRGTEQQVADAISAANDVVRYMEPDAEVQMIPELEAEAETSTWGLERIGARVQSGTGAGITIFVVDTGKTYGVAKEAKVKGIKVLSDSGRGSWSWTYGALDYIARKPNRPSVASMSLGGESVQEAMKDAVDTVVNGGVVVVVASGNSNKDACGFSPAYVPSAITVGSITQALQRSSFSNYGACTNIWAPGSRIVSASQVSDTATQTLSGTSMACPHVAGAAALHLQANPFSLPWTILGEMTRAAATDSVTGLSGHDSNVLLNVASI